MEVAECNTPMEFESLRVTSWGSFDWSSHDRSETPRFVTRDLLAYRAMQKCCEEFKNSWYRKSVESGVIGVLGTQMVVALKLYVCQKIAIVLGRGIKLA